MFDDIIFDDMFEKEEKTGQAAEVTSEELDEWDGDTWESDMWTTNNADGWHV